jgi:ATP-dependent DNA ligase
VQRDSYLAMDDVPPGWRQMASWRAMKRTLQRQAGGKLEQPSFLQPPITPMPVTAVSRFPVGDWMYEPKWDGFRCLIFRDGNNVFLQSRTGKSLTAAFPEIVKAVLNVDVDQFVLDGEVAIPTDAGFSFNLLVNRLRVSAARLAQEVKANPAIYIAFDILADKSKSLLRASISRRRRGLEEFFRKYGSGEGPLYLSANTSELGEVQNWINHIGLQLDGVVAKKADAIYDPGNKRAVLKIKRYRTVDCIVGGFRDRQIGSSRNSLLLGLWDSAGQLHYVGSAGWES